MATQRLFIGLPLPEEYQRRLESLRRRWSYRLSSRLSWTRPGNWHITLQFLGDTDESLIQAYTNALAGVKYASFALQGGGAGFFPPPRDEGEPRPRVVWVGLKQGGTECTALSGAVGVALQPLGFTPESRPFRPHLTLARVKEARRDPWQELLAELLREAWPACMVERFVLWRSVLGPQGPTYFEVAGFPALQA